MGNEIKKDLDDIRRKLATLERVTEEVRRLRQVMEDRESLRPRFVESSPQIRTYGGMIESLFKHPIGARAIYIMGYFDQVVLNKLVHIADRIKIISPSGALGQRRNKDALTRMSKAGAQVRIHPMLHARIFCIPDTRMLIVGSGDLQTNCFGGSRFDAGIYSNYPELINSAIDFFNRVWEESDPLPETSV